MSNMISRQKLKPCPFCGSDKIRLTNWGLYRCWCTNCLAQASDEISEKDAVEAWNRRESQPQADPWIPCSEIKDSLLHRIAEYFKEWDGTEPAPTMQMNIDELRSIVHMHMDSCILRGELKEERKNAGWIPCSDIRKPADGQKVVVTVDLFGKWLHIDTATYHAEIPKGWWEHDWEGEGFYQSHECGWCRREDVVAWFYTEPYKGVE